MKRAAFLFVFVFPLFAHAGFKAGFAERDVTPEIGMEVFGNYGKSFAKRIHDPCKARAAVFENGGQRIALVGLDTLIVPRQLVLEVRALVQKRCGISPNAILIGASHSHSSGPLGSLGDFDDASDFVKDLAINKSPTPSAKYYAMVRDAVVEAIVAADAARADATAGFGSGTETTVAFNRRIRMKNGVTASHPGKGNPDNLEYAGPVDPQVGVIGIWDADGKLMGTVVNFACHATANGPWITANWIYYMERAIQGYFGTETKVVYLQGACGDVTQVDNLNPAAGLEGDAWSQMVGGRVGAEAVKVLLGMSQTRINDVPLAVQQSAWEIPRRAPSPEHVAAAFELAKKAPAEAGPDWVWAKETVMLDALIKKQPKVEVEVQAIQIGPVVCITNPAEYFCQFGLELKAGSGFPMTFPVELANGGVGYVPTEAAFASDGGGYETRLTSYSNLEISAGRQLREAGLKLARELSPIPLPKAPPAPPFKQPWDYGRVAPQLQ